MTDVEPGAGRDARPEGQTVGREGAPTPNDTSSADISKTVGREGAPTPNQWSLPKLRVDANGDWYDDDVQVTHAGILANLMASLERDASGYFIQTRVRIPVEVEDVPWVVVRVERRGEELHAFLNDGSEERIDPATLRIETGDVPHCTVKEGRFEARLSRAAAFQLLALAEPDAAGNDVLELDGRVYPLRRSA